MPILDNFLFVGDSFTNGLKTYGISSTYGKNCKFVCAKNVGPKYFLQNNVWKTMPDPKDVKGVCLLVGINSWNSMTVGSDIDTLIQKLLNKYTGKKIYVQRVFPVNPTFNFFYKGDWKEVNKSVAKINRARKAFCDKTNRAIYIDTTKGFSSNAVLNSAESFDGLHIVDYGKWQKNIFNAVTTASDSTGSDTPGGGGGGSTEDPTIPNGYPPVIKKLLPDTLSGTSYKTVGFEPKFIVIHNMGGAGESTNQTAYDYWSKGSDGHNTSAHYCIEPGEIWQTCEDTWIAHHAGTPKQGMPGADAGAKNSNSFGLEMADGENIDKDKALDNMIELTRHLMKKYTIPQENIYQHFDINGVDGPGCPQWIRINKKWDYFLEEVKKRNDANEEIKLNFNGDSTSGNGIGTMPNFDNREDLTNIEKVKSLVLVHHPPEHFYSKKNKTEIWEKEKYDRNFHFEVDSKGFKTKVDNTLITWGMQPNDKHTYIDRALHNNKPYKYCLNIGMFTSHKLEDYTVTEKILIDRIGKVLWENALETKDIWREFDLNRAPSPFMYLEREQWKKFLREVNKQVEWRYENFGEPPVQKNDEAPDGDGGLTDEDISKKKENIGKNGKTIKQCSLWKNPSMTVSERVKILSKDKAFKIIDFDNKGYYKVEMKEDDAVGWIYYSSVEVEGEVTEPPETFLFEYKPRNPVEPEEENSDSDPVEDKAGEKNIPQPEIIPTMTHEEYLKWKSYTDPKIIDNFAGECEPYDKGLEEIINADITEDDRLIALTKQLDTRNENTIYFNTVEGSPGTDGSHCAINANELNLLIKPDAFKVDPIYPDLIIPPNYSTTDYNIKASNALPLTVLLNQDGTIKDKDDFNTDNLFFDYDLLKDKKKESKSKPVNYLDPYPYDDKIYELENHKPKVKIDEVEARLYDSNHPGDPVAHPIAKNFANVYDMAINQSKKIESRLVRIENTLATVLRNLGRIGSRININCLYYGGQDIFGKFKTIRCMRDDRIHDAGSMTLDQCLCCTRYEPVIGQIYEILDDTGMNGSVMLDNMQMSYMDVDDIKSLNRIEERSMNHKYANVNKEEVEIPKTLTEVWEEADKEKYIAKIKETITDEKELEEKIKEIKQEDYAFRMNWLNRDLDLEEPDVKMYPTEGIKAKYKTEELETPNVEEDSLLDATDQDHIEDLEKLDKINQGEWIDTREDADTYEKNVYTSEDYFFEGFNSVNSFGGSGFGAEARNKICEMAKIIVQDHADLKACYSQQFRTNDYNKPVMGIDTRISQDKITGYDCSSLVSCCYNHAGLKEITNKNTTAMGAYKEKENVVKFSINDVSSAKPGDIVWRPGHTGIYLGNNEIAHASSKSYPERPDIRVDSYETCLKWSFEPSRGAIFIRPADLIAADAQASASGGACPSNVKGPAVNAPSSALIRMIKGQEGFMRVADYYSGESWKTGGYGIIEQNKQWYNPMAPWPTTEEKATQALIQYSKDVDCSTIWKAIQANNATDKFTQHQYDAFLSLAHNWSAIKVTKSSFFKQLCQNPNDESAFTTWSKTACTVKDTGKFSPALQARRKAEIEMYKNAIYVFENITIWDGSGKISGVLKDNGGHGWLPSPIE